MGKPRAPRQTFIVIAKSGETLAPVGSFRSLRAAEGWGRAWVDGKGSDWTWWVEPIIKPDDF